MRRLLFVLALLVAGPARAEWWEAKTDHFIVYSLSSAKDARTYAEQLERFDQALGSLQGIVEEKPLSDSQRLTVFRFGDISDMEALARRQGLAGFYIPRATGPVAFVPAKDPIGKTSLYKDPELDTQTVFFHEYAHHFMYRHFTAAYPSWYREAFAEVNSTIELRDDGSFELGSPPQSRAGALLGGLNYSVKRMLLTSNRPNFEDVYARYTYGWLLTHYLTFGGTRKGQLPNYLRLINAGTDAATAARQAFGDLDQLETEVLRYKAKNRYPGAIVRPGVLPKPQVAMRRLGPDEEAIMRVRARSARGVNKKTSKDVAADARAVAARYAGSLPVQLALAEAEFDAERLDEAEPAADAALAINPRSSRALLYKGLVYLKRAKTDARHYPTARSWFGKASQADPGDASPLLGFYMTYKQAGAPPPPIAVQGLERAFELAPYDATVRVLTTRQLLVDRRGPVARQVLLAVAHSPHESKYAKELNAIAELIEANKLDEALAKLNARLDKDEKEKDDDDTRTTVGADAF